MQSAQSFIDTALARSRQLDTELPSIAAERHASAAAVAAREVEAGTAETWKYLSIAPFLAAPFGIVDGATAAERPAAKFLQFPAATAIRIDGAQPQRLDAVAPADGVSLTTLRRGAPPRAINESIDVERYPLAHVNTALLDDALLISVGPGIDGGALDLRFVSGADAANVSRVRIELGAGARLRLIEQHGENKPTNAIIELAIGDDAVLEHTRLLPATDAPAWLLASVRAARNASYELTSHALGSPTRRHDIHVRLDGERARADISLACAVYRKDKLDHHLVVEHGGVDTTSRQIVHGLAAGNGELTFDGRIHIRPGAQRSDARLTNKNLLLDKRARINAKPELEIYANDVKCSHGATVGQLDPMHLFYLRTRGLDETTARAMLTRAFLTSGLSDALRDAGVLDLYAELFL
jgi:Fe-S cluster assembly protein SufD